MRLSIRKRHGTNVCGHPIFSDYNEIIHTWMLQALIPLGAHKAIIFEHSCGEDDVLHELGLSHFLEAKEFQHNEARQV